ncbi:MAG: hypothetical protein NZM44_01700, partial [Candidatus Calescibacterium sp.]|nr:hypothetical protein [Candidatus Calescibacterium sp.]
MLLDWDGKIEINGITYNNRILPHFRYILLSSLSYTPYLRENSAGGQVEKYLELTDVGSVQQDVVLNYIASSQGSGITFLNLSPFSGNFIPFVFFFAYITSEYIDTLTDTNLRDFWIQGNIHNVQQSVFVEMVEKLCVKIFETHNTYRERGNNNQNSWIPERSPFIVVRPNNMPFRQNIPSVFTKREEERKFALTGVRWTLTIPQDYPINNLIPNNQRPNTFFEIIRYIIIFSIWDFRDIYDLSQGSNVSNSIIQYIQNSLS